MEDGNLSPSMALHRLSQCLGSGGVLSQAGLGDWAGPGLNKQGSLCACVCVCPVPLTLRQLRTPWTISYSESVSLLL